MVLRANTKLFGSNFTIERHREDGSIETKTVTEQCYLVGETESLHTSVAISDCDGLVTSFRWTHIQKYLFKQCEHLTNIASTKAVVLQMLEAKTFWRKVTI